jgi:transcriptional regulator with XRE-family HTH domain
MKNKGIIGNIGEKIKSARKSANLTQKELADKVGITHEWICKIEKGKASSISFSLIEKIMKELKLESKLIIVEDVNKKLSSLP